jgi:hypothetical protein
MCQIVSSPVYVFVIKADTSFCRTSLSFAFTFDLEKCVQNLTEILNGAHDNEFLSTDGFESFEEIQNTERKLSDMDNQNADDQY